MVGQRVSKLVSEVLLLGSWKAGRKTMRAKMKFMFKMESHFELVNIMLYRDINRIADRWQVVLKNVTFRS